MNFASFRISVFFCNHFLAVPTGQTVECGSLGTSALASFCNVRENRLSGNQVHSSTHSRVHLTAHSLARSLALVFIAGPIKAAERSRAALMSASERLPLQQDEAAHVMRP